MFLVFSSLSGRAYFCISKCTPKNVQKDALAATCIVKKRRKLFFASVREPSLGKRILKMFRVRQIILSLCSVDKSALFTDWRFIMARERQPLLL